MYFSREDFHIVMLEATEKMINLCPASTAVTSLLFKKDHTKHHAAHIINGNEKELYITNPTEWKASRSKTWEYTFWSTNEIECFVSDRHLYGTVCSG